MIKIEPSWYQLLKDEFDKEYFKKMTVYLKESKKSGTKIYPPGSLIFNAFDTVPVDKVKLVILGQDPYHNPGEAMGLSFSVPKGVKIPPSLRNIFKEIQSDLNVQIPSHGDLSYWADQGVFLLNTMLTVEHRKAGSHKNIGWQNFTMAVINQLSQHKENLVFLLWGRFAQNKGKMINRDKHLVLEAPHPSPLAGGAFFGCKHFSKANAYLISKSKAPIDWQIL